MRPAKAKNTKKTAWEKGKENVSQEPLQRQLKTVGPKTDCRKRWKLHKEQAGAQTLHTKRIISRMAKAEVGRSDRIIISTRSPHCAETTGVWSRAGGTPEISYIKAFRKAERSLAAQIRTEKAGGCSLFFIPGGSPDVFSPGVSVRLATPGSEARYHVLPQSCYLAKSTSIISNYHKRQYFESSMRRQKERVEDGYPPPYSYDPLGFRQCPKLPVLACGSDPVKRPMTVKC